MVINLTSNFCNLYALSMTSKTFYKLNHLQIYQMLHEFRALTLFSFFTIYFYPCIIQANPK